MKLKNLVLVFENCEYIEFEGSSIFDFIVEDIETSIRRIAINSIDVLHIPHVVAIEIQKNGDGCYRVFNSDELGRKFGRIKEYNDITSIEFDLVDRSGRITHFKYKPVWDGEYDNKYQTVYESSSGNLYIVISDIKQFEDIFQREIINARDYVL